MFTDIRVQTLMFYLLCFLLFESIIFLIICFIDLLSLFSRSITPDSLQPHEAACQASLSFTLLIFLKGEMTGTYLYFAPVTDRGEVEGLRLPAGWGGVLGEWAPELRNRQGGGSREVEIFKNCDTLTCGDVQRMVSGRIPVLFCFG